MTSAGSDCREHLCCCCEERKAGIFFQRRDGREICLRCAFARHDEPEDLRGLVDWLDDGRPLEVCGLIEPVDELGLRGALEVLADAALG